MSAASDRDTHSPINLSIDLAMALQRYGLPSHRIEDAMDHINEVLGLTGQFYVAPTSIFASFGEGESRRTYFIRGVAADINLEKLDAVDQLAQALGHKTISVAEARRELEAIQAQPDRYGPMLTLLCFMLGSAGAARLFGGGWREILVSAVIGTLVGVLVLLAPRLEAVGRLIAPLAAIGAIALAKSATLLLGPMSLYIPTVTGLIVLLPGLSLTVGMVELATGHLVSGTSRLANAGVFFLLLGFGIGLGGQIEKLLPYPVMAGAPQALPGWTQWPALVIVALSFAVLFRANPRHIGWVFLSGVGSFLAAMYAGTIIDAQMGGFLAALFLGLMSNVFARLMKRPATIMLVPGIMLLVPGSIGFKSISSLLEKQTLTGVETGFAMTFAGIALVAGLIFANVLLPPKTPF